MNTLATVEPATAPVPYVTGHQQHHGLPTNTPAMADLANALLAMVQLTGEPEDC